MRLTALQHGTFVPDAMKFLILTPHDMEGLASVKDICIITVLAHLKVLDLWMPVRWHHFGSGVSV